MGEGFLLALSLKDVPVKFYPNVNLYARDREEALGSGVRFQEILPQSLRKSAGGNPAPGGVIEHP